MVLGEAAREAVQLLSVLTEGAANIPGGYWQARQRSPKPSQP
jgi:hypothetical protein